MKLDDVVKLYYGTIRALMKGYRISGCVCEVLCHLFAVAPTIPSFAGPRHWAAIAKSVIAKAILIFLAQCFFARRIFLLSKRNYYLTIPILVLAVGRLGASSAAASEMFKLGSYMLFREKFRSLFSVVLALSSAVDIMVTLSLLALLQDGRQYSLGSVHSINPTDSDELNHTLL
ncbi:hypothetical protein D9613_004596 [Agrocybe pediades]|uniref:Uncharacterized protein n=1 Tax=Agrocybe pediades TaxID=84607 RepID=A0A8H4VIQ8_9AGAR|nr:hypothetical protein D9613_004596 [Agrocybe pediades]